MKITDELMCEFLAGRVDAETRTRIQHQLKLPGSDASRWFEELRRWAKNVNDVDWGQLLLDDESSAEKTSAPAESSRVPGVIERRQSAILSPAMVDQTTRLCLFSYPDLLAEFSLYGDLVRGSVADDPLAPYRQQLERILCHDWNWVAKRENPAYKDEADLALAVANVLKEREGDLPFPPEAIPVVAAILARTGLDDFCRLEEDA